MLSESGVVLGWLVLGALAGGLVIGLARRVRWYLQVRFFAASLFLAGVIYLALGAFQGARWIAVEGAGLALFPRWRR